VKKKRQQPRDATKNEEEPKFLQNSKERTAEVPRARMGNYSETPESAS